jgi:hypothetical protein
VIYSLKARVVESQQLAITRHWTINNNRGMVFSALSVIMAAHTIMEYVMPSLNNKCTVTEEQCFLFGLCRDVISRTDNLGGGSIVMSCCCEKLVAEARESLGTQRKGNIRHWKPLPSNGY